MLEELGRTADEVAATLLSLGIRGVRNTVRFLNPVVRYATAHFPEAQQIDLILGDTLRVIHADGREELAPVPAPVLDFLGKFHDGDYPDLEMPARP
jgi:hypothetical protein